jgi:hypothetical protein
MPNDRDGHHAGGSPVDTIRANSSLEEIAREDAQQDKGNHKERTGKDKPIGRTRSDDLADHRSAVTDQLTVLRRE